MTSGYGAGGAICHFKFLWWTKRIVLLPCEPDRGLLDSLSKARVCREYPASVGPGSPYGHV